MSSSIYFDKGTLVVKGDVAVPHSVWDDRTRAYRAQALFYRDISEYFRRSRMYCRDDVQQLPPCPELKSKATLRGYQARALRRWEEAGRRGIVVLPTGAGKTLVGVKAMEAVNEPSLVVVPTLDLLDQWKKKLEDEFGVEVGTYGGGEDTLRALTVSTYDSAYLRAAELGNRFSLAVFDEVHHLAARSYRQIGEMFTAPWRLGLTATYEREDMLHTELPRLTGGVVFRMAPGDLAGRFLSEYTLERRNVELTEEEKESYDRDYSTFSDYVRRKRIWMRSPRDFQRFVMMAGSDPEARQALLARNRAMGVALNSEAKMKELEGILKESGQEKTIIFTQHNELVYRISRRFLLPFITHTSGKEERHEVLEGFRKGRFRAVVTSKVLDEGIDVPDASLGVIVSGTGSRREFVQRLGRLLRKREGKQARLIELVSRQTTEAKASFRRKRRLED